MLPGGPEGPEAAHLEVAEKAISCLEELQQKAREYLDGFVDRERLGGAGDWELSGLNLFRHGNTEPGELDLQFDMEQDDGGPWSVSFRYQPSAVHRFFPFFPYQFSRLQQQLFSRVAETLTSVRQQGREMSEAALLDLTDAGPGVERKPERGRLARAASAPHAPTHPC